MACQNFQRQVMLGKCTSDGAAHPMRADKIVMAAKAPAAPPNTYIKCKASEHELRQPKGP